MALQTQATPNVSVGQARQASLQTIQPPRPTRNCFSRKYWTRPLRATVVESGVLGAADGLTVPFALTAGLSALDSTKLVWTGGLTEVAAGSISMGISQALALQSRDNTSEDSEPKARPREILWGGLATGSGYAIAGIIGLTPYFFALTALTALAISIGIEVTIAVLFGYLKLKAEIWVNKKRGTILRDYLSSIFWVFLAVVVAGGASYAIVKGITITQDIHGPTE